MFNLRQELGADRQMAQRTARSSLTELLTRRLETRQAKQQLLAVHACIGAPRAAFFRASN